VVSPLWNLYGQVLGGGTEEGCAILEVRYHWDGVSWRVGNKGCRILWYFGCNIVYFVFLYKTGGGF
jgi:hypothetical protein